jgi:hypothetical protein
VARLSGRHRCGGAPPVSLDVSDARRIALHAPIDEPRAGPFRVEQLFPPGPCERKTIRLVVAPPVDRAFADVELLRVLLLVLEVL